MTTFEKWQSEARGELTRRGVDGDDLRQMLEEARAYQQESGLSANEALGTPEEFAAQAAGPRDGRADTQNLTVPEYICGTTLVLVFLGFVYTAGRAVLGSGEPFSFSAASLTGDVLFVLAWIAVTVGADGLRAAGRPRWASWSFGAAAALIALIVAALTLLPRDELFTLSTPPALLLLLVAGALLSIPLVNKSRRQADPADPEAWFARLEGLLVGRHDLPAERAAELVREARTHVEASGNSPEAEFGPLNSYAQSLADSLSDRSLPWWRKPKAQLVQHLLIAGFFLWATFDSWSGESLWRPAVYSLLAVYNGWAAMRAFAKLRS